MEHIVQFGINIDDEVIKESIERQVLKQVCGQIRSDMMKTLDIGSNYEWKGKIREIANELINEFCTENKEEIIERASERLVDKLWRTKQVKDRVSSILDDVLD